MRKPTLILAAIGAHLLTVSAHAEDSIAFQGYQYNEDNNRIDVRGGAVTIDKNFGTDYELNVGIDYDTVTGATPMWVPVDGYVNEYEKGKVELAPETRNGSFASLLMRDTQRNEYTVSATYSTEPDYLARGLSAKALLWHDDSHNRSYSMGVSRMFNRAIASDFTNHVQNEDSTSDYLEAGVTQVINARTTLETSVYYGDEDGYLTNQYLQIVRVDNVGNKYLSPDDRPDSRASGGLAIRGVHAWQPGLVTHLWYRFYKDDWGIHGNTLEAKLYWDISPVIRLNPVYRVGNQSAADFYRDYSEDINYFAADSYGSNDARLGDFDTQTVQFNVEYMADKQWSLNTGVSQYSQDNGFDASWLTAGFVFRY